MINERESVKLGSLALRLVGISVLFAEHGEGDDMTSVDGIDRLEFTPRRALDTKLTAKGAG